MMRQRCVSDVLSSTCLWPDQALFVCCAGIMEELCCALNAGDAHMLSTLVRAVARHMESYVTVRLMQSSLRQGPAQHATMEELALFALISCATILFIAT